MKNKLILIISFILIVVYSCKKEKTNINNTIQFKIYDSIKVNYPSLQYVGFSKNKILFSDRIGQKIIIFDENKNTKVIDKRGNSPKEYGRIISKNVSFLTDSTIAVSDIKVIKVFDLSGNFKNSIYINNEDTYAPLQFVRKIDDSIISMFKGVQGNPSIPSYYMKKQKLFVLKNIQSNRDEKIIDYPLQNSDIVLKDSYLSYIYGFDVKYVKNFAFLINSNDEAIYKINLYTEKVERLKINLDFYKTIKYNFGDVGGINEQIIDISTGSLIEKINIYNNYLFIHYNKPYNREFVLDKIKARQQSDLIKPKYLQILKNNKKLFDNDILIPRNNFGVIEDIISLDSLLVKKVSNEKDEKTRITTYYWAKIEGLSDD